MPRLRNSHYIYSVSRIRALENKLLGPAEIDRMVDATTPEQALKVLYESGYGTPGSETLKAEEFEKLLEEEHLKLYSLLQEIAPVPGMFNVFLQPYDFYNIKVIIKAEFFDMKDFNRLLTPKGTIAIEELIKILRDRRLKDLPPIVGEAVEEAIADLNHTHDPQTVDLILDKACFARMQEMAENIDSHYLKNFMQVWVDLLNIQICLRMKRLKKDYEFFSRILLPGGHIKAELLWELQEEREDALEELLKGTRYRDAVQDFFKKNGLKEGRTLSGRLYEDFIQAYIHEGRKKLYGLEALLGYMLSREAEFRCVRAVMSGKLYGVSGEKLRERLRDIYA